MVHELGFPLSRGFAGQRINVIEKSALVCIETQLHEDYSLGENKSRLGFGEAAKTSEASPSTLDVLVSEISEPELTNCD